jgi:hypothetical protein
VGPVRIESSATTITWIPSEAVAGATKVPFAVGVAHYDPAPPEVLVGPSITEALATLRDADRFRFANHLSAWIEVEGGRITAYGQDGSGMIGATTVKVGRAVTVAAVAYGDIRPEPEVGDRWVRFRQSAGGRTGLPAPRHVSRSPFVQIVAPTAWTTLDLTIHDDGRSEVGLAGASPFPRHWVYDHTGTVTLKSGLIDFRDWYRTAFGRHSPWGDEDSPALVTEVETALERQLSVTIMSGGKKPRVRTVAAGGVLVHQGDEGAELFLLLDGVLGVDVEGERLAELGPGAVLGERALLEGGTRTSSLVAVTPCKVAVARRIEIDPAALEDLRDSHRREELR